MADPKELKDRKWELVQIKAFKSWVNSALASRNLPQVDEIHADLQDGVRLIQFLEIVSGKTVNQGKYDKKPEHKIQKIGNLNLALEHIQKNLNIRLVGIAAEDIYDGNLKLTLGLLWTLFRALRINSISEGGKSSEDALLLWVKKMTAGYDGINITSFRDSFNDGLAFSALIHKFDETLINYKAINAANKEDNLDSAFGIAEGSLGIPKLLEASDLASGSPDERSVILYVSLFFHAFVANEKANADRDRERAITQKVTDMEALLESLEEEKNELIRSRKSLQDRVTELEKTLTERQAALDTANEKIALLDSELEYMRQRALADAETIRLLEEKNALLSQLLEGESLERGEFEEGRARLLAELEAMRSRSRELAGEKEGLEELRKRLISENSKKEGVLSAIEARNQALLNELEQLRNLVKAEMQKRKDLLKNFLALQKEMEALKNKQIAQGKARVGLDILRRNLEEHLEDMYRWRELHQLTPEDEATRVFDLDQVTESLKDKTFEQQLEFLDDQLQAENKSLLRIIRLKDSEFQLKEVEAKSGWLFMKGRKDWKRRWFSLRGFSLYYFENDSGEKAHEGLVDLSRGCEVVRQKAVKEEGDAKKQWPLKITVGERKLFVRAATKKERHSWYLFLASKIAHLNYLKSVETSGARVDTRLITLFNSESITDLHLDNRPIGEEAAIALSKTLPAHDETELLSLINTTLDDNTVRPIAEVLEKLSLKSVNLSKNKIGNSGATELAKGIAANVSLTELNLDDNQIGDAGAEVLFANIQAKPSITSVSLAGNKIGAGGARAIAQSVTADHPFPVLNLSRNNLGDDGAAAIAKLLSSNKTISKVFLAGNNIGDAGVAALAKALSGDALVTELDLADNNISADGAQAIHKLLQANSSLVSVNVSGNKRLVGSSVVASLFGEGFSFPSLKISRD